MAERRMFSKRIVNSARFLKMPVSTQCLYFHLGLHADDDGVVEAYTIMNVVGATEDDLKILVAKNFVNVLNEDLVTYITDWRENNKLRADRKVDSIYKDLLIQVIPDIELLGKKQRADRAPKLIDNDGTSHGQPMDGIGKDSIGKDRLGEESIEIDIEDVNVDKYVNESNNLKNISRLYEQNIGLINGVTGEWLIEISEQIESGLFKRAIEIATDSNKCTLGYVKGIIKKWLEKDITTLDKLEAYKLQQNQKEVDSDVRRGKGNLKNEGPTNDSESEEARRRELLRQIEELERDEL